MPEREKRGTPTQMWIAFDTLDIVSRKLIREEEEKRRRRRWSLLAEDSWRSRKSGVFQLVYQFNLKLFLSWRVLSRRAAIKGI